MTKKLELLTAKVAAAMANLVIELKRIYPKGEQVEFTVVERRKPRTLVGTVYGYKGDEYGGYLIIKYRHPRMCKETYYPVLRKNVTFIGKRAAK